MIDAQPREVSADSGTSSLLGSSQQPLFSPISVAHEKSLVRSKVMTSLSAGWTSILAVAYESDGQSDTVETAATPDQSLVIVTRGQHELSSYEDGRWHSAYRGVGSTGMTPGGETETLRWRALGGPFQTVHLYVPQHFLLEAFDEYRRTGSRYRQNPLSSIGMTDPLLTQIALAIMRAAESGAPDLYAACATRFVIRHLLGTQYGSPSWSEDRRRPGRIMDGRVSHVLEYMRANFMRQLTVEELSREVNVSPQHFAALFKQAVGMPPHRFLSELRLEAATSMLTHTGRTVLDIALSCGYANIAHFSHAFKCRFHQSPTAYRRSRLGVAPTDSLADIDSMP